MFGDEDDSPTTTGKAKLGLPSAPDSLELNASINDYLADENCRTLSNEFLLSNAPPCMITVEEAKRSTSAFTSIAIYVEKVRIVYLHQNNAITSMKNALMKNI